MKNLPDIRLRPVARTVIERIVQTTHDPKIRYIMLFGSEARGEATLTGDIDLALVGDEPLTRADRRAFAELFDDIAYPDINIITTRTADLETDTVMDVNYHLQREGLIVYER